MLENTIVSYTETAGSTNNALELGVWVPAVVSVISLIITIIFTVYISPIISSKQNQKIAMYKICSAFFDYLTDIASLETYEGVPSKIRKYSIKIHLMFKSGEAPQNISELLEIIYQLVRERKRLSNELEIINWEKRYREKVHELRKELSKYVGVFR